MNVYTYPEAADKLRVSEDWLRRNIKRLPRSKKGRRVTFTDADLERIERIYHVEPDPEPTAVSPAAAGSVLALKPLPSRRRSA